MNRPNLGMLFALAACLSIALPATALSIPQVGEKDNGLSQCDEHYTRQHAALIFAEGQDAAGRNYVREGLLGARAKPEPVSNQRACREAAELRARLHPPAPEPVASSTYSSGVAPAPVTTSVPAAPVSSGGCPSYMAAEATSPDAVNPTSGAAGCYQILPSTQAAHGCADVGPECAAVICATEGPGAWAASGANPCPYLQP